MRYRFVKAKEVIYSYEVEAYSLEEAKEIAENDPNWEWDSDWDNILFETWWLLDEEGEELDSGILYKDDRLSSLL